MPAFACLNAEMHWNTPKYSLHRNYNAAEIVKYTEMHAAVACININQRDDLSRHVRGDAIKGKEYRYLDMSRYCIITDIYLRCISVSFGCISVYSGVFWACNAGISATSCFGVGPYSVFIHATPAFQCFSVYFSCIRSLLFDQLLG